MMHDFAITDQHAVFLDLPITFSARAGRRRRCRSTGTSRYGARIGVMPLDRPGEVRWYEVDPSYVFHVGNAHTDAAGRVVLDAARYAGADAAQAWQGIGNPRPRPGSPGTPTRRPRPPTPAWPGCTAGCSTRPPARSPRRALDDRGIEFPTIDDDRVGRDCPLPVRRLRRRPPRHGDRQVRHRRRGHRRARARTRRRGQRGGVRPVRRPRPCRGRRLAAQRGQPTRRRRRRSCSCSTPPTSAAGRSPP